MAVNGQWPGKCIDQFPMAVVVVNCSPLWGALTACHPQQRTFAAPMQDERTRGWHPRAFVSYMTIKGSNRLLGSRFDSSRTFADIRGHSPTFDVR